MTGRPQKTMVCPTERASGLPAQGTRDFILRVLVLFGATLVLITEALSLFNAVRPWPLAVCWLLAALVFAARWRGSFRWTHPRFDPVVAFCLAGIGAILTLTAVAAGFSPPNSADAMAYHMPRVVYWAEQGSVRFFPTTYFNQIMLQPMAEYAMLHSYVVSGGDRFINFGQWFAGLGSMIGVSCIARMFGAPPRGQAAAALFCATLPAGILASSGAKNDYWLAMWLVAAVYFALRFAATSELADGALFGGALGLALLTKGTAYLFAPWILAAVLARRITRKLVPGLLIASAVALALNAPQYARNYDLSGSVLGFDAAHGDGKFRWRNETFGWKHTVSNILRNTSEQLGDRSERWNRRIYEFVAKAHGQLGVDLNDPQTTWRWATFIPPVNAKNHEADAHSRWHLAILAIITCVLVWRGRGVYALALICAFIAFCAYLKWQPYQARLLLPLIVLGAPLAGVIRVPALVQVAVCLFLLNNAKPALFENWIRPLKGPRSVLRTPRTKQYFADLGQFNNEATYPKTLGILAASNCETIGIDIANFELEYPLQALLRETRPGIRFVHTGVQNASSRYPPPASAPPCAVVCLNCADDSKRLALYSDFLVSVAVDRFVIFLRKAPVL